MPFLHAVFCLKGFDDRNRFFATSVVALLGFIFFSAIFSNYVVVSFATLLILTTVLTYSTKRRLHDAKLNKNWQLVPGGLLLLTGLLSLIIENSSSYYLLILPALSTALLLTYPSKNNKATGNYILGYYGPVDLSIYQQETIAMKPHNQRIEPTLLTDDPSESLYANETTLAQSATANHQSDYQTGNDQTNSKQVDIGELIRIKFLGNRKLQLGIFASVALIFIAVLLSSLVNTISQRNIDVHDIESTQPQVLAKQTSNDILANKKYLLAMPDNFNLYLSEYQGIIIHWQADQVSTGQLWSLSSAKGDKSCQSIKFNKGSPLRPLSVLVENGSEYFASFSPLDSQELVQALAFRGKFSLCGYSFSLKGSQAVLGKHNQYAPFLDKDA
ncbi:hypothetical protein [Colwellia psychrerythraea]|uniref:DUF805 domain-containing protein n=1 Tax=Colwellia psychrerythraea TaxID=28229 RepID=A0A099KZS2_COLPS|nr:hypothetical protein [Colwellia psychrerythraea]KGJ96249.1 hypothetical protein GAB14E_0196 [Colwellia psychrerythraea]